MTETYRPKLHFTPAKGWMNDANGMIRHGGLWHLFFQHDPDSIHHGPMHWGHAVSRDLVNWQERPVALYPDALGTCFSGSAIAAPQGVKLFYTAHSLTPEGRDFQVQCIAHANETLTQFQTDTSNPVLGNPGREVFRDPKVIWHQDTARWIMLVTEGQSIAFYAPENLRQWDYLSSFGACHGQHGKGVWECPDLLVMHCEGKTFWVLIVSISKDAPGGGSGTQYFIGAFDGARFTNANPAEAVLWLDMGRDFYAPQSFFDPDGPPTVMAWASNWSYARQTPTKVFRGAASLPRELSLTRTPDGLRIAQQVPEAVRHAFASQRDRATFHHAFYLEAEGARDVTVSLFEETVPHLRLTRGADEVVTLTSRRPDHDGLTGFGHEVITRFTWPLCRPLDIELFVDRGLVEMFCAGGTVSLTNLHFPAAPEGPVTLTHHASGTRRAVPRHLSEGGHNG